MEFETRTDTINSERNGERDRTTFAGNEPQIRFAVQIGAFKDPQNANAVQMTARERFQMPVVNDYQASETMYNIRIGNFASKDSAYVLRDRIQREYPDDYKDSWIVQFTKQP